MESGMSKQLNTNLIRISEKDVQNTYCCMTESPTPWQEALCYCRTWVLDNLGTFVDGYHLQLEDGVIIGHLYYADSEQALFPYDVESGAVVIYCEWIQERYQRQGFGKVMFAGFLDEMKRKGKQGILVETTDIEGQMYFKHYISRGFNIIREEGHQKLLYYPISEDEIRIQSRKSLVSVHKRFPVEVLVFRGFLCPYEVSTYLLLQEIAPEFGEQIVIKEIWISPETLQEYGVASGILINGKLKLTGGESESAVRQAIREEL
jgi:predicted GNAT family acetyltransferase